MRLKIPCKKYRLSQLASIFLVIVSVVVQAEPVQNTDHALFWSIQKDGKQAGYLLGTIHSEDPRVLDFSVDFLGRLNENTIFAMELVPDLPTLARLAEYMNFPPGRSLESVIGAERFERLEEALSAYRIPADFVSRMKPWAAMMTLSTPPPNTGFFMDFSLSLRASGSGLKVVGLETLEQQLSFLEDMPMPMQLSLLDQALAEFGQVREAHDEMVSAYLKNNLAELQVLADQQLNGVGRQASEYFTETGIRSRNFRMIESLVPYMNDNRVFVAVGALHLPGEDGLLNLLRQQGFELTPLEMPFAKAAAHPGQ